MKNLSLNEKYLIDKEGHRIGVFLSMEEYRSLLNRIEELEAYQSTREKINIVDQILSESKDESPQESLPTFKRRQGPGGMIVV